MSKKDLVQAFFERDLSEAEDAALSKLLLTDEAAAARFAELSVRYAPKAGRAGKGMAAKLGLGLALGAALLWWAWPLAQPGEPQAAPLLVPAPEPALAPTPLPAAPRPTPQPSPPPARGDRLILKVALPQDATVTAQVLDASGHLVRRLQAGYLQAGEHRFAWDRQDDVGRPAPAGRYQIVIDYGSGRLDRWLEIGAKAAQP